MSTSKYRLKFEAERLKHGPITYDVDVEPRVLDLLEDPEYTFNENIVGEVTATLVGDSVLLQGHIQTVASAPCARCLEGLPVPLYAKLTLVYMTDERLLDPITYPELYEDNTFYYDGDVVYPAEQFREQLLLQLPPVPRCELEEGDFCPVRGVHVGPMVFGPEKEWEEEVEELEDSNSLSAQMKKLRQNLKE